MLDTILHYAAYKNNKELIGFLISKNADLSIKNSVNYLIKRHLTPAEVCEDKDL
jgi:hypothetical protein